MKTTRYFDSVIQRPDRSQIKRQWILETVQSPDEEAMQADGRIRRWKRIAKFDGRYLCVILLDDGETIHNAFFDRGFKP